MSSSAIPAGSPTEGYLEIRFLPTISGAAGPTVAEWAAGTDLTYYFTSDGWNPGGDQATVTDDRLTARQTFELPGKVGDTLDVVYTENQTDATANAARTTLAQDQKGFIVDRRGIAKGTAAATTQKCTVRPVWCGVQREMAAEANAMFKVGQKLFITGPVRRNVAYSA